MTERLFRRRGVGLLAESPCARTCPARVVRVARFGGCGYPSLVLSVAIASLMLSGGCRRNSPAAARASSAQFATLQQKIDFLQKYVMFRRTYETLDFNISTLDGDAGLVPGPSEWDVRVVATVPASELAKWIPQGVQPSAKPPDQNWLTSIPTSLDLSGVDEWYDDGGRTVGIDREQRIVVYRDLRI